MDVEKKYKSNFAKLVPMKQFIIKFLFFSIIILPQFQTRSVEAVIPYYYKPQLKNLKDDALSIGKTAYQLLYFGQVKDSLNLAKLGVKINKSNETLWTILAEAQIANKLYQDALVSLEKAHKINPMMGQIYFAKSTIYLQEKKIKKAKVSLKSGINLIPSNYKAIFQLGNIYLMEKSYEKAIKEFDNALKIKSNFWEAINNKGLAFFELDDLSLSIKNFKEAIELEENAESLLALASCLKTKNIDEAILLAQKALKINPKYVDFDYRKEHLWGDKIQKSTELLFQNNMLKQEIITAKSKI